MGFPFYWVIAVYGLVARIKGRWLCSTWHVWHIVCCSGVARLYLTSVLPCTSWRCYSY